MNKTRMLSVVGTMLLSSTQLHAESTLEISGEAGSRPLEKLQILPGGRVIATIASKPKPDPTPDPPPIVGCSNVSTKQIAYKHGLKKTYSLAANQILSVRFTTPNTTGAAQSFFWSDTALLAAGTAVGRTGSFSICPGNFKVESEGLSKYCMETGNELSLSFTTDESRKLFGCYLKPSSPYFFNLKCAKSSACSFLLAFE